MQTRANLSLNGRAIANLQSPAITFCFSELFVISVACYPYTYCVLLVRANRILLMCHSCHIMFVS